MEKQVLSIDQCKELVALGLDMSDASMCWITKKDTGKYDLRVNRIEWKNIYHKNYYDITPTYTLQDILLKLPQYLYIDDNTYELGVFKDRITYDNIEIWDTIKYIGDNDLIIAAFEMLKWCKQNNYI